ncbi:MAG: PqqD family protein [Anaerolineaceae bacterium]|nr:PqqD family protein [Anaerolineaceae bacterium]MDD4042250.1 PqqD family protein [Anaerolineaceae bacterium]MDD4578073.1 PqqD family protein [Anaerolineaceae bacterium]
MTENSTQYKRNPDFVFRKIADEVILVPVYQNTATMEAVFALNEVGALLWSLLEEERSEDKLNQAVLLEFEVEPEVVKDDVRAFLDEMLEIGAVSVVEA